MLLSDAVRVDFLKSHALERAICTLPGSFKMSANLAGFEKDPPPTDAGTNSFKGYSIVNRANQVCIVGAVMRVLHAGWLRWLRQESVGA